MPFHCHFPLLFTFFTLILTQTLGLHAQTLNLHESSPVFLSQEEVLEDIQFYEALIANVYGRYSVTQNNPRWKSSFRKLRRQYLKSDKKYLSHHFLEELIQSFAWTNDSFLSGRMRVHKRNYQEAVASNAIPLYSSIKLIEDGKGIRVAPNEEYRQIANLSFVRCEGEHLTQLLPIFPERLNEPRFILALMGNQQSQERQCWFKNELDQEIPQRVRFFYIEPPAPHSQSSFFEWDQDSKHPYLRWSHDGNLVTQEGRTFLDLAARFREAETLILDVRNNTDGSFAFIEKWLLRLVGNRWESVVLQEKQSLQILEGLINQVRWQANDASVEQKSQLRLEEKQLQALVKRFKLQGTSEKWVETKFIFTGQPALPKLHQKLVVITNHQCGAGCQFLAALAKQLPNGILIGAATGAFPRNHRVPLYQLPHSKIHVQLPHFLHRDPQGQWISNLGYLPDIWLEPSDTLSEIKRNILR